MSKTKYPLHYHNYFFINKINMTWKIRDFNKLIIYNSDLPNTFKFYYRYFEAAL